MLHSWEKPVSTTGTAAVIVTLQKRQKACLLVLSNPPLFGHFAKMSGIPPLVGF